MKISLMLPSNRTSLTAIARIMEWASLDPEKFELIVRDNSEDERKRELLAKIDSPTLKLHCVPRCGMSENGREVLRLATGEFVIFVADDDWLSVRGLQQLHALAEQFQHDDSVIGVTGAYLVETSSVTGFFRYSDVGAAEPVTRINGYLQPNTTNFLFYSIVRRSLMSLCVQFADDVPYKLSFHDQLIALMYLALGRVLQIDRVVYGYDLGEWETTEGSLGKDRSWYVAAGLPVEYDRLHHLFCALEGALLLRSNMMTERTGGKAAAAADLWFQTMFFKFAHHNREMGYAQNAANAATLKLRDKLLATRQLDMHELLLDVCETLEVSDPAGAQRYFKFWSTL